MEMIEIFRKVMGHFPDILYIGKEGKSLIVVTVDEDGRFYCYACKKDVCRHTDAAYAFYDEDSITDEGESDD